MTWRWGDPLSSKSTKRAPERKRSWQQFGVPVGVSGPTSMRARSTKERPTSGPNAAVILTYDGGTWDVDLFSFMHRGSAGRGRCETSMEHERQRIEINGLRREVLHTSWVGQGPMEN
jgi:hypothetical protein